MDQQPGKEPLGDSTSSDADQKVDEELSKLLDSK